MNQAHALIYSPNFDGHRQVYVFVLVSVLKELNFKIWIAGDTKRTISNSFYIDKIRQNPGTNFIDTSKLVEGGINITPSQFSELQNQCKADLTIFAEADHHISLLVSQAAGKAHRFRGDLTGIFLRPFYFYYKSNLLEKLKYLKHLPSKWRNDDRLFHEFFLRRFTLLNSALSIDENFVDHHKFFTWLPDVFQQYADSIIQDEKKDQRIWIDRLNEFTDKNRSSFFIFYFGTAQSRRGYDLLLKLAEENNDCFIHCGLQNSSEKYVHNVETLRSSLSKKGLLFETNEYIADPVCVEHFFKSLTHLILPYRNFYGSSGVMLQALSYGIPVMVPEDGLMGYRVKKHNLGSVYNGDERSFIEQFNRFKLTSKDSFSDSITQYMKYQSVEKLKETLMKVMKA